MDPLSITGSVIAVIQIADTIIIIIIHTPYRLRHAVLLLFLSHRKPSNGENCALQYCHASMAPASCDRRSLIDLFIST
jgi:hypothetical protein